MAIAPLSGAEYFLRTIERSNPARRAAATMAAGLPSIQVSDFRVGGAAAISVADGRDLVARAVSAAEEVVGGLRQLQSQLRLADHESFLDAVPDLSRLTISADVQGLIRDMDKAVEAAEFDGRNLASGTGGEYRIATTGLGGTITVPTFGLDSRSLGIDQLDLTTESGVAEAISRVASAAAQVASRSQELDALSRAFSGQDRFIDDLAAAISSRAVGASNGFGGYGADARGTSSVNSRGSAINIFA